MGAVAAGDVGAGADLLGAVGFFQARLHAALGLLEPEERDAALDRNAEAGKAVDQHLLVRVLRIDHHVGEGAEAAPHVAERDAGDFLAAHPEIDGAEFEPVAQDDVGEADLAIELEGPRLHGERPRRGPGLRRLGDDAQPHTEPREKQGEHQPGRAGADDQNLRIVQRHAEPPAQRFGRRSR